MSYVQGFVTNLDDVKGSLASPYLQLGSVIERLLLNGIIASDNELVTNLIAEHYGAGTGQHDASLFLEQQRYLKNIDTNPDYFKEITDMVDESFKTIMPMHFWKLETPTC